MNARKNRPVSLEPTLTPRQLQTLRFLADYRVRHGCSPTLQEIASRRHCSKVTVFEHVEALVQKGLLERQANRARSLTLSPAARRFLDEMGWGAASPSAGRTAPAAHPTAHLGASLANLPAARFPLAGVIAAGGPVETFETPEELDLACLFRADKRVFALRVRGESMIDEHIRDGDYVLVRQTRHAQPGQIVVAILENGETTLKKFYPDGPRARLQAANPAYAPILTDHLAIQGVVLGVIRRC